METRYIRPPYGRTKSTMVTVLPGNAIYALTQTGPTVNSSGNIWYTHPSYWEGKTVNDVVTPGFRQLQQAGQYTNTPMSSLELTRINVTGTHTYTEKIGGRNSRYDFSNLLPPSHQGNLYPSVVVSLPDLEIECANEVVDKALQQNVMTLVDLAEIDKTYALIADAVHMTVKVLRSPTQIPKVLSKFKKMKPNKVFRYSSLRTVAAGAKELIDTSGNLWLQWHYGVMPLMFSIEGAIKTYNALVEAAKKQPPTPQTYRSKRSTSGSAKGVVTVNITTTPSWSVNIYDTYTRNVDRTIKVRCGLVSTYKPCLESMASVQLRDLPATVYELIPFSFVVDWFWPLGTFIRTANLPVGFSVVAQWTVVEEIITTTDTWERNVGIATAPDGNWISSTGLTAITVSKVVKRTRVPTLKTGIPDANIKFSSSSHLTSGMALLNGLLFSGKSKRGQRL